MALYKDTQNVIHDDMDGLALSLPSWPQNLIQITQAEADAILNPPPTVEQQRAAIQSQIDSLEVTSLMNRMLREFSIGQMETAAIQFGAAQVPALTEAESLALAYATNIAYKKTKDLDNQIIVLRTQMDNLV